jgi:hypothetical protein
MTWTASPTTDIFTQTACVAWNGFYWLAGGEKVGSGTDTVIALSEDGITWNPLNTTVFDTGCRCIAWNGRMWVAGGYSADGTVLAYMDGLDTNTWTPVSIPGVYTIYSIATNGTIWVAGGEADEEGDGIGVYSYDGINWTTMTFANIDAPTAIVWTGFVWVVGGTATANSYSTSYSYDGIHWINNEIALNTGVTLSWNGSVIVYGGSGGNPIYFSTDGKLWYDATTTTFIPNSITWNGSLWIGVGAGTGSSPVMAQSYDGIVWTAVETPQIRYGTVVASRNVIGLNAFQYVPTLATGPVGQQTKLSAHIVPTADLTYDLGATGLRFRDIYVGGTSIYMGDSVVLKASGTNFSVTTPAGTNNLVSVIYGPNPAQVARNFTASSDGGGGGAADYIQGSTGTGAIRSIATSADGSYISAIFVDTSGQSPVRPSISVHGPSQAAGVFTINKTSTTGTPRFNAIAMSASGQRQIAVQQFTSPNGGGIYVSGDYGVTWAEKWRTVPNSQAGQNFIAAAVNSTYWFAATATALFYTDQAAGAINTWTADTEYSTKNGPVNFTGITQIQASNDGKYLVILDATNLDAILYDLEDESVGVYDLTGYTSPVISNVMEYGGFSVLAINASSQPCIINFSNDPTVSGIEIVIPATGVTTPKILISSQDSMFKLAVFNTAVANVTVTYFSSNYGIDWVLRDNAGLQDVTSILFSATANLTYLVRYQSGATQQSLFTSTAVSIYTQNSSLPYSPANPNDWPVAPTTLTAAVDELATVAFSSGTYPTGSYTDPVTNVTVTGPIISMGATGSAGPIILQAGLSATHVLEKYTATGLRLAYSQTKTQPGSYTLNTVYGPNGPGTGATLLNNVPQVTFNTSRGYATGPTSLQDGDYMGAIFFKENTDLRGFINAAKVGNGDHASMNFNVGGGYGILSINTTGPDDSIQNHNIKINGQVYPESTNFVNLGATGYQFNNIHFGGTLYQNGLPFQQTGLTYRATGPTGPTGGATGPRAPTLQIGTFLVPTVDATYDLGATGIQFKDVHFSGSLYNNGVPFSGAASYSVGSYKDPLTNVTVTGPILSMGATGSAGPIILQAGLSPNHVLESYTTTGPNLAYSQVKAKPGSYSLNTVYGPSGPDPANNLYTYVPQITFNTSRGYATGPTDLQINDPMGAIFFNDNTTLRSAILAYKDGMSNIALAAVNQAGGVVLASADYVPPPPPASQFEPIEAGTAENCIQPQTGTPYASNFSLMASSADGQYITVAGPGDGSISYQNTLIMVSSDSGSSFTPNLMSRGNSSVTAVAVSQSGRYQIVVENDPGKLNSGIFVSNNYGSSWSEVYLGDPGVGAGDFTSCAVSETSPSGNPIFVAVGITQEISDETPSLLYCRGLPVNKASWTKVTTYAAGASDFLGITSVAVSNDGTRLVVMDTGDTTTKRAVFYQITAGAVTYKTNINVASITGENGTYSNLANHVISNITSAGFTMVAANSENIISFQANWSIASASPTFDRDNITTIRSSGDSTILPTKIVASSDGVYQLVQCSNTEGASTNTYLSSNSGYIYNSISQNSTSPFDTLATIAMSADASRTYCLSLADSYTQALRTSLSVSSYVQSGPTTALTYRATGPTDENGAATGPRAPTTQISSHFLPLSNASYDIGATGIQFRDVHFSGSLYNNGVPFSGGGGGGTTGLTYRATGPTGPTGGPTGPYPNPTIQIGTHLVPTTDLAYDLGATGLRFRDLYVGGSSIHIGNDVVLSASNGSLNATNALGSVSLLSSNGYNGGMLAGFGVTATQDGYFSTYYNSNTFSVPFPAEVTPIVLISPLNLYQGSGIFTTTSFTASNVTQTGFKVYTTASNVRYSWMALPETDITPTPPEILVGFAITNNTGATTQLSLTVSFDRSKVAGSRPLTYTLRLLEGAGQTVFNVTDEPSINGTTYTYVVRNATGLNGGWPTSSLTPGYSYVFALTVTNPGGSVTSSQFGPFSTAPYTPGSDGADFSPISWSGNTGQIINIAASPESMRFSGNIGSLTYYAVDVGNSAIFNATQLTFTNSKWRMTKDLSSKAGSSGIIQIYAIDSGASSEIGDNGPYNKTVIDLNGTTSFGVPYPPINVDGVSGDYAAGVPAQTSAEITLVGSATGGTGYFTYELFYRKTGDPEYVSAGTLNYPNGNLFLSPLTPNTTYQYYINVSATFCLPVDTSVQTFQTPNYGPITANTYAPAYFSSVVDPKTTGSIVGKTNDGEPDVGIPGGGNYDYSFQLFLKKPNEIYKPQGTIPDASGWNFSNLTPNTTYQFYVRVSDSYGSTPINVPNYPTVSGTSFLTANYDPPNPATISLNYVSTNSIYFFYYPSSGGSDNLDDILQYREVTLPVSQWSTAQTVPGDGNVGNLNSGTRYQIRIFTTDNVSGISVASDVLEVDTSL